MDEIAIVGVGCRFPGANNLKEYWRVLSYGENHVKEIPRERWNADAFYDPDPNVPGKAYVRNAAFVSGINEWDNKYYGINDIEAELVDPQQRLVLDCVRMALEDGSIMKKDIDGNNIGVYIGSMTDDYKAQAAEDNTINNTYTVTGIHGSIISARVAYAYNLTGPAVTLDTACSSSLVAIDIASQAIQTGKCSAAICGGVNVLLDPQMFIILSKARMLSPSGQCKTFTAEADGYARGEGCGIVILKSLNDAKKDGNRIWATIRTGTNQDGHMTVPITAPSGSQQELLIENLFKQYQIDKSRIRVIEAHGTGTPIGDPIEVNALAKYFGKTASTEQTYIGSVKTNIGHLEAAAAMAGIIKVLLMMKNRTIVPSLWYTKDNENPKLNLSDKGFTVPTECIKWQPFGKEKRIACVNSFGFGGTNAHAVLEEYIYSVDGKQSIQTDISVLPYIVTMSAYDKSSLVDCMKYVHENLNFQEYDIAAVSCTSTCKQSHRPLRKAIFGESQDKLIYACKSYIDKPTDTSVPSDDKKMVFVFCGVGTAWKGMCCQLMKIEPFRNSIKEIDRLLQKRVDWSITEKFSESCEILEEPFVNHIAIFACQIALAALWKHFGVEPDVVIGQSVGEVAAAYTAGYIDLKTAVRIIYHRSKYLSRVKEGTMAVVRDVDIMEVNKLCERKKGVSIAVYSSSLSCTVSGRSKDIEMLIDEMKKIEGLKPEIIELNVGCAYHSTFVNHAAEKLAKKLRFDAKTGKIPFISTVTGKCENAEVIGTPEYWKQNVAQPVMLSKAVETAGTMFPQTLFLEIGPSPVLQSHIGNIRIDASNYSIIPSMKKNKEIATIASSLCTLYEHNVYIEWSRIYPCRTEITDIPTHHLRTQKKLYQSQDTLARIQGSYSSEAMHLFVRQSGFDKSMSNYVTEFDPKTTAFIYEHIVSGTHIIPGATYADIGFVIGRNVYGIPSHDIMVSLEFLRPMKVETGRKHVLQITTTDQSNAILFHVKNTQNTICKGWISPAFPSKKYKEKVINIDELKLTLSDKSCKHIKSEDIYAFLESIGFRYGKCFQMMKYCDTNEEESITEIEVPDDVMSQCESTILHPCILDSMIQSTLQTTSDDSIKFIKTEKIACLPVALREIYVIRKPEKSMYIYTRRINMTVLDTVFQSHYNVLLTNSDGLVVAEIRNYTTYGKRNDCLAPCDLNYIIEWHPERIEPPMDSLDANILVLTNSKNEETRMSFTEISHLLLFQKEKNMSISQYVEVAIETGISFFRRIQNKSAVLLIIDEPQTNINLKEEDITEIHRHVRENCFIISTLLKRMMERNVDVPVYIASKNTQSRNTDEFSQTVTCGAFWGFVRSITLEFIYNEITLIDLQPSLLKTKKTLIQLISNSCQDIKSLNPEIVIHHDTVYGAQFSKTKRSYIIPNLRAETKILGKVDANYKVCSPNIDAGKSMFLTEHLIDQEMQTKGKIKIQLQSVFELPLFLSHITTSCDRLTGCLGENENGIYGIEYIGYKMRNKSNQEYLTETEAASSTKRKKVICVYPSHIMTEMSVPKECTIRFKKLPHYEPGMLLFAVLCWKLAEYVPKHSSVLIYSGKNSKTFSLTLESVLYDKRQAHVTTAQTEITNESGKDWDILMIIEKMDSNYSLLRKCKKIMYLHGCVSEAIRQHVALSNDRECISLNTADILTQKHVSKCLPAVVLWLKGYQKELSLKSKATQNIWLSVTFPFYTNEILQRFSLNVEQSHLSIEVTKNNRLALPIRRPLDKLFNKLGVHIVTGGSTGLGWEIIRLLVEMGATAVATISRRCISPEKEKDIALIESKYNCKIMCIEADVAELKSLQSAIHAIQRRYDYASIRGIFHCAGVLHSKLLNDMEENDIDIVLQPKVIGTMNLHLATHEMDLDYFVVSSSINSLIGIPGQSSYGAANCFLDNFMEWRRRKGLVGQSIRWGALNVGMASRPEFTDNFVKRGFNLLSVEEIRCCLQAALLQNSTSTVYGDINWESMSKNYMIPQMKRYRKGMSVLFDQVVSFHGKSASDNIFNNFDVKSLQTASKTEQKAALTFLVKQATQLVTGMIEMETSIHDKTVDLGFDSMSTLTFINVVHDQTGYRIQPAFMANPERTLHDIVQLLLDKLFDQTST